MLQEMFFWWPWQMPTLERLLEKKTTPADGVKDSYIAGKRGEVKGQLQRVGSGEPVASLQA